MDDETRRYLDAMEARLMGRLTNAQEAIIERARASETTIAALTEIARSINTTLDVVANLLGDVVRRVTDLEKKP